jgi:hypothetical protein
LVLSRLQKKTKRKTTREVKSNQMIYNLLLYMGIFFIVAGFSLFLYSEIRLREIDIQLFKLEQRIKEKLKNERL